MRAKPRQIAVGPSAQLLRMMATTLVVAVVSSCERSGVGAGESVAAQQVTLGAPAATPSAARDQSLQAMSQRVSIEMYSARWCGTCRTAKAWLDANHVAYNEIDIDVRSGAREQLRMLNPSRTIPTFDISGQVYVGFNPSTVTSMIESAAR